MSGDQPTETVGYARVGSLALFAGSAMLVWVVVEFLLRRVGVSLLAGPLGSPRGADMLLVLVGFPLVALGIATWGRRVGVGPADWDYDVSLRSLGAGVGGLVVYFVCLAAFVVAYTALVGSPTPSVGSIVSSGAKPWVLVVLFVANGVVGPLSEELAWRGVIQTALTRESGALVGVLVTAAAFVLKHVIVDEGEPVTRLASLVVIALVLGGLRARYGTASSSVAHVGGNLVATAMVVFAAS